jgi:lysophospholipase L1-like esterase
MALGDSITAGGSGFESYRYFLSKKLAAAGYAIEFVGSRTTMSPIGDLRHEGYPGKSADYLAGRLKAQFQKHPADIVLIHSGHNYSSEQNPVTNILAATESMIQTLRSINSNVIVLLAQVIPSGKLPKYAYIPELNRQLAHLANRLNTPGQRVMLVNQAEGFDWRTDTVHDLVHPNAQGAEKIASRWFAALQQVLDEPAQTVSPESPLH